MKKYPADTKVTMILADDVRPEMGNKLAILGYYSGGDIRIEKPPANTPKDVPLGFPSLCFLWILMDGVGPFHGKMTVQDPKGKEVFSIEADVVTKTKEAWGNWITKANPFIFSGVGAYTCTLFLDGKKVSERSFDIAWS